MSLRWGATWQKESIIISDLKSCLFTTKELVILLSRKAVSYKSIVASYLSKAKAHRKHSLRFHHFAKKYNDDLQTRSQVRDMSRLRLSLKPPSDDEDLFIMKVC